MPIIASRSEDLKAPTPQEPISYDSVSSRLPHALAALTLKRSASRDSGATHEKSTSDNNENNERGGTDSGYASAVPTPVSSGTPENSGTPETSHMFPQGIQDVPPIPYRGAGKEPASKVFDKPVSQTLKNRFEDLNELFGKSLMDRLVKSGLATGEIRSISIKLKFVGRDEETAVPCVIILCNKSTSRTVKHFFSSKQVKIQYQPTQPSVDAPRFEIKVWERPPRLIGAAAYIFEPSVTINMEYPALCGTPFAVRVEDEMRYGSFGGFVMVQSFSGSSKLYAMSAGHMMVSSQITTQEAEEIPSGTVKDLEDDNEGSSIYSDLFGDELELEWDDAETEASSLSLPSQTQNAPVISWIGNGQHNFPTYIGDVVDYSHSGNRIVSAPNLDWSLIETPNVHDCSRDDFMRTKAMREEWKDVSCFMEEDLKGDRAVLTLMGTSGRKTGILSSTMSYLAISPGQSFVKTYTLKLDDGARPNDGDCGSWVVDSQIGKVYGHIVALDTFGEAYIVPLRDSFQDIANQLGCASVHIPTGQEICDYWTDQGPPVVIPVSFSSQTVLPEETSMFPPWVPLTSSKESLPKPQLMATGWQPPTSPVPEPEYAQIPQQALREDVVPKLHGFFKRIFKRKPKPQPTWPQPVPYVPYEFPNTIDNPYATKFVSYAGDYTMQGMIGVPNPYYSTKPPMPPSPPPAPTDSGYSSMQQSPAPSNPNSPAPQRQEPLAEYQPRAGDY